jgi:hypothetical protein
MENDLGSRLRRLTETEPVTLDKIVNRPKHSNRSKLMAVSVVVVALVIATVAVAVTRHSGRPTERVQTFGPPAPANGSLAPLADPSPTPPGWAPVELGAIQVSVPSSWHVEDPGHFCANGVNGMVFINEHPYLPAVAGCSLPPNLVSITVAQHNAVTHATTKVINGIRVEIARAGADLVERALGMQIEASGPLANRVLRTITHSPLSVVLRSTSSSVPKGWRPVTFGGLHFYVPPTWKLRSETVWPPACPANIARQVLELDRAQAALNGARCTRPPQTAGYDAAQAGMVLGAGPQIQPAPSGATCRSRNGLRICVDPPPSSNEGFEPGHELSLLTAQITWPGQRYPDQLDLGLTGDGLTPLRIFDSSRPVSS